MSDLKFNFEGREIKAEAGQTVAGALHKTGVRTLSRSIKYHTPRGYTCGFGACGDCPLNIDGMPNTVSCTTPVRGGEDVKRETGLPSAGFDILRTADFMRPWLGAGFQFKLFAKQPALSKVMGRVFGVLAGGGRMPSAVAIERATVKNVHQVLTQVLVIGGGLSGITAALAAANAGQSVLVVDKDFLGGRGRVRTELIEVSEPAKADPQNTPRQTLPKDVYAAQLERAREHANISFAYGVVAGFMDGVVPVINGTERVEVTAQKIVVATGSYEVALLCPGADQPGVMLADAALKLLEVERVLPGKKAVIVADDARASDVAERLKAGGVEVVATVNKADVVRVTGWSKATGLLAQQGANTSLHRADLICVAGKRRPAEEIALHLTYADSGSHDRITSDSHELPDWAIKVGSAAGSAYYSLPAIKETITKYVARETSLNSPAENLAKK